MISNNLLLLIVVVLLVISEVNKNNQINNLKKERFEQSNDTIPTNLDIISIKNLSNLASNLISHNGQNLNLEYKNFNVATSDNKAENINMHSNRINLNTNVINIPAFRHMISPFWVDFNVPEYINTLKETYWFLCDGQNNTPDLQGRFIYGGRPEGNNIGQVGGAATVTLGIEQIPSHTHNITSGQFTTDGQCGAHSCNNYHGERTSTSTGGGQPHENMPPYMVIAYFMYNPPDN